MAIDVTGYMNELAEAAGIPADQRPAFLSNEKVKAVAHKALEAEAREKGRAEAIEKKRQEEYAANLKIFNENKAVVDAANARVTAYVQRFGELPGGGDPTDPNARREAVADAIDKKTFDERLGKAEANSLAWAKITGRISASHMKEFNEVPDFDAIEKIALEQGLNADKAYAEYVRPKREERAKAEQEAALKKAREEGEIEGRSKVAAGTVVDAEQQSPFMANLRKSSEVKQAPRDAFTTAWREAETKK